MWKGRQVVLAIVVVVVNTSLAFLPNFALLGHQRQQRKVLFTNDVLHVGVDRIPGMAEPIHEDESAMIRRAYDTWRFLYNKGGFDSARFENFSKNYKTMMLKNEALKQQARREGKPNPTLMQLDKYADSPAVESQTIRSSDGQQQLDIDLSGHFESELDDLQEFASSNTVPDETSEVTTQIEHAYREWCRWYGKLYDESKVKVFASNYKDVKEYFKKTGKAVQLNKHADLTAEEYAALTTTTKVPRVLAPVSTTARIKLEDDIKHSLKSSSKTDPKTELEEDTELEKEPKLELKEDTKIETGPTTEVKEDLTLKTESKLEVKEEIKIMAETKIKVEDDTRRKAEEDTRKKREEEYRILKTEIQRKAEEGFRLIEEEQKRIGAPIRRASPDAFTAFNAEATRKEEEAARNKADEESKKLRQAAEDALSIANEEAMRKVAEKEEAKHKEEEDARIQADQEALKKTLNESKSNADQEFSSQTAEEIGMDANKDARVQDAARARAEFELTAHIRKAYMDYCTFYKKEFDESRIPIFGEKLIQIKDQSGDAGTSLELDEFADLTPEECMALKQKIRPQSKDELNSLADVTTIDSTGDSDVADSSSQVVDPTSSNDNHSKELREEIRSQSEEEPKASSTAVSVDNAEGVGTNEGIPESSDPVLSKTEEYARRQAEEARQVYAAYTEWCREFGKDFDETRLENFAANFRKVQTYEKNTGKVMALNEHSDLSKEEYNQMTTADWVSSSKPTDSNPASSTTSEIRAVYNQWCEHYGKEPSEWKFPNFQSNYLRVERHFKTTGVALDLNEDADLSPEERATFLEEKLANSRDAELQPEDEATWTEVERVKAEADSKIEELEAKLRAAEEETRRKAEEVEEEKKRIAEEKAKLKAEEEAADDARRKAQEALAEARMQAEEQKKIRAENEATIRAMTEAESLLGLTQNDADDTSTPFQVDNLGIIKRALQEVEEVKKAQKLLEQERLELEAAKKRVHNEIRNIEVEVARAKSRRVDKQTRLGFSNSEDGTENKGKDDWMNTVLGVFGAKNEGRDPPPGKGTISLQSKQDASPFDLYVDPERTATSQTTPKPKATKVEKNSSILSFFMSQTNEEKMSDSQSISNDDANSPSLPFLGSNGSRKNESTVGRTKLDDKKRLAILEKKNALVSSEQPSSTQTAPEHWRRFRPRRRRG